MKADRSLARKTQTRAVFPAPDHDHERCASDAIAHAEAICAARAERLTPIRRRVLEALLASHQPLGAYELIDRLAVRATRPAPITIYRALDFLREQGLVHRIESRNAFIACVQDHGSGDPVVFLICEKCGTVGEAASAAVADYHQKRLARRRLHAENAGDRDLRHLRALQGGVIALLSSPRRRGPSNRRPLNLIAVFAITGCPLSRA